MKASISKPQSALQSDEGVSDLKAPACALALAEDKNITIATAESCDRQARGAAFGSSRGRSRACAMADALRLLISLLEAMQDRRHRETRAIVEGDSAASRYRWITPLRLGGRISAQREDWRGRFCIRTSSALASAIWTVNSIRGRASDPPGRRSITSSSFCSIASDSIAAPFATWVCAAPMNSRCLAAARSRNTCVAVSTSDAEDSRKGKVTSRTPSRLRLRAAARSHNATPNPAMAVAPGWRVLAKSTAPRQDSSFIPTREAASDASFEGVKFERSSSTVRPICDRNRFAWAS